MLPAKRKREKMGVRQSYIIRCPAHLAFVRSHECSVPKGSLEPCQGGIEAAHVRSSGEGGVGMKPGDNWSIPLCRGHHIDQHARGEAAFERVYRINMKSIAEQLWKISPAGQRYRAKMKEST